MIDPKDELKAMGAALEALEPLDPEQRARTIAWLASALGTETPAAAPAAFAPAAPSSPTAPAAPTTPVPAAGGGGVGSMSPKEFLAAKAPTTDVERLTCLAYYLTHARETAAFSTKELTELNTEAAGRRFTNAANTGKNATNHNGYLTGAGGRKRQITHLGEQVVEAMPDREAVKAAISAAPNQRKRASRRSKAKTKAKAKKASS